LSQNKGTKHKKKKKKKKLSEQSLNPHHREKDDGTGDSPGYLVGTAQL
jgi:hypothetical protein